MTAHTESGYPVLPPSSALLRPVNIPDGSGPPTRLTLHWGAPAFLLGHLALGFDKTVEDLNGAILDDWAYAYRAVIGYSAWSDHSGGEAMDLNAIKHPLGHDRTFSAADEAQIHRLLERYHGALYWGGNYHNRPDEMHFGCVGPANGGSYSHLEQVARSLLPSRRGKIICAANPGLRAYVLS